MHFTFGARHSKELARSTSQGEFVFTGWHSGTSEAGSEAGGKAGTSEASASEAGASEAGTSSASRYASPTEKEEEHAWG